MLEGPQSFALSQLQYLHVEKSHNLLKLWLLYKPKMVEFRQHALSKPSSPQYYVLERNEQYLQSGKFSLVS